MVLPMDQGDALMAAPDPIELARHRIGECIAQIEARMPRLTPAAILHQMDAIRTLAAAHGLTAVEGLAGYGAHHAMLPGRVEATRACLARMDEALSSEGRAADRETILALLAVRLH
jgi:hypothetical protein